MILRSDSFHLFLIFASVVSSFIFCVGFFPYAKTKAIKIDESSTASKDLKYSESHVARQVLMIIDALRLDFIESESFSYLNQLLDKKEACLLKLKVNLPTVTKPRIKALVSGTIPSFLDVAMNFGSDEMKIDSFIHQLKQRKQKIVFAGDDTWTSLFKGYFTRETANRDSLFVNDFYAGDINVTNALKSELNRDDWKLLILHFLGLDHIGHVEGPFSKLVPPKLKEMDQVVKLIHQQLLEWNKTPSKKSVLYITGDHGMRDSGGHSGNSFAETHVPLLIIGGDCQSNYKQIYNQIDFAATFSLLNGLPIPTSSIGSLIPEMLMNMTQVQKLDAMKAANEWLMKMAESDGTEEFKHKSNKAKSFHQMFSYESGTESAFTQAESNYLESSRDISNKLAQQSLEVNLFQVLLGLVVNVLITAALLIPCDDLVKDLKLTARSFVPFVVGGFILKLLVINEVFEEVNDLKSFLVMLVMMLLLRVVLGVLNAKYERRKRFRLFDNDLLYLLVLGHFFFVISVGSSSFIEEEHQIWYYFCNTMFAFITFHDFRGRKTASSILGVAFKCFAFLALHVFIRRMNATGDKWINVPDIGDWLHREQNVVSLHVFIIASLIGSTAWLLVVHCQRPLQAPFIVIGNILLYFHHTRSLSFRNDLPITTIFWINLLVVLAIDVVANFKAQVKKNHFFVAFFLVSSLLHQPQNVIMTLACTVTCWFLNQACSRMIKNTKERVVAKIFLHLWTGKLFYFYQGNSNSLSTIDVNAGFVGQSHVHLPIIFIFSTLNTFNGQLTALFLLVVHLRQEARKLMDDTDMILKLLFKWLSLLTIIPTTVFLIVITILRHHLFIWSVFSPKLLYDFYVSALMLSVMLFVKLAIKL